ncbi:hypothetical protein L2E82_38407 [Cichorium intybus]|uniref:Uncharacterized protein n=1 Tax=Cichorium intybus TaxID=13427 RepID=A0ACB9AFY5_CICIN|nr:hypothetical protein L2E82_38407 [Cichorium intybus]
MEEQRMSHTRSLMAENFDKTHRHLIFFLSVIPVDMDRKTGTMAGGRTAISNKITDITNSSHLHPYHSQHVGNPSAPPTAGYFPSQTSQPYGWVYFGPPPIEARWGMCQLGLVASWAAGLLGPPPYSIRQQLGTPHVHR